MNDTARRSAIIEQMRIARNVPTFENRKTWTPIAKDPPPPPTRIHPRLRPLRRVLWRHLGLHDAREICAALEDIQVLLVRCGLHLHLLRAERKWKRLESRGAARAGGPASPRPRGRPADAVNFAYHQLGLGLAIVWFSFTGRHLPLGRDAMVKHGDVAHFRAFVAAVVAVLPARLQVRRKGHVADIETFLRSVREAARDALDAPEIYRRLGLLDERRWGQGKQALLPVQGANDSG